MASLVEYFKMPMREIESKYTLSEIALISWRSQEVSASFQKKTGARQSEHVDTEPKMPEMKDLPEILKKYSSDELGEMDLRKMTGTQLRKYFAAKGLVLPILVPNK